MYLFVIYKKRDEKEHQNERTHLSGSTYLRSNGPLALVRDSPGLFNVSGPPRSRPPVQWRPLGSSLRGILLARWLAEGRSGTFGGFAVEPGKAEGCNLASPLLDAGNMSCSVGM
jgi:hypothetical protein